MLRKAAAEAELADLSAQFTGESRAVRAKRFQLDALGREMKAMRGVGCAALPRSLGRLRQPSS